MSIRKFVTLDIIPASALFLSLLFSLLPASGCGGGRTMPRMVLPANIAANPRGTVGVVAPAERSFLPTSLRALGIPYHRLSVKDFARLDLTPYTVMILDEDALEYDEGVRAYARMIEHTIRTDGTLIVLNQRTKTLREISPQLPLKIVTRDIDYAIDLAMPRRDDPIMRSPNPITPQNLDSLSGKTSQLVFGGRDARALIAANLQAPDSSATLLWEPLGQGTVWYLSMPITAYAAAGYEAEQKLMANLVSNK